MVEVTLTTCGIRSRDVMLVLAGDAMLADARVLWQTAPVSVERRSGLVVSEDAGDAASPVDAQTLLVHVQDSDDCSALGPSAVALQVAGHLSGRVQQVSCVLGVRAPRQFLTWPAVGWVPGMSPNMIGAFKLNDGIPGEWYRPQGTFDVPAGQPALSAVVESASPVLADYRDLHWTSAQPFEASASVIDLRQNSRLQNLALLLSLLFGVLSAVVLQLFVRTPGPPAGQEAPEEPEVAVRRAPPRPRAGAIPLLTLGFIGWRLSRRHRTRSHRG